MYVYIARRLILFIPTIILVSIISFLLLRVVPGDPAVARLIGPTGTADFTREELMAAQKKLGTDRPLVVQYFDWSGGLLTGDLGRSMFDDSKVNGKIARGLPISVELAIGAIVISLALAIPLGIVSAVYQNTWIDYVGRFVAITGITVPFICLRHHDPLCPGHRFQLAAASRIQPNLGRALDEHKADVVPNRGPIVYTHRIHGKDYPLGDVGCFERGLRPYCAVPKVYEKHWSSTVTP